MMNTRVEPLTEVHGYIVQNYDFFSVFLKDERGLRRFHTYSPSIRVHGQMARTALKSRTTG